MININDKSRDFPSLIMREETFGVLILDKIEDRFYFLDRKGFENIRKYNEKKTLNEIIDLLTKNGMVKEFNFEINGLFLKNPCTVTWEITHLCNLNCFYCFSNDFERRIFRYDLIDLIINNFKDADVMRVILTGGEPVINMQNLFYILKILSKTKMGIVLSTNGTLIDDRIAKKLKEYISYVQISLDGKCNTHDSVKGLGAFEKAIDGIECCTKNGIFTQVNLIPTKLNEKEIIEVISLCEELGVKKFHLFPLIPRGKATDVYEKVKLDQIEIERIYYDCQKAKDRLNWNINISLSRRYFSEGSCILVKPDGSVHSPSYDSDESIYVGNLENESLMKLWVESTAFNKKNHLTQTNPYMIIV